jgi:hypothetical protein
MDDIAWTPFGDWTFLRRNGLAQLRHSSGLICGASATVPGLGIAGVDAIGIPDAKAPTGAREQIMRLRFRSRGLFNAEPESHLALGLMGQWRKPNPIVANSAVLTGRGIIIGNVSGAPNGCSEFPVVQVESFYSNGNALLAGTGSGRLREEIWYSLEFGASVDGQTFYDIRDESGASIGKHSVVDRSPNIPPNLGGWWICHAFSDLHLEHDWEFDIADIAIGWR